MTAEERALALVEWCLDHPGAASEVVVRGERREAFVEPIALAIRAAILSEREAIASAVGGMAREWAEGRGAKAGSPADAAFLIEGAIRARPAP